LPWPHLLKDKSARIIINLKALALSAGFPTFTIMIFAVCVAAHALEFPGSRFLFGRLLKGHEISTLLVALGPSRSAAAAFSARRPD
jgi:hypothetical protein